MADRKISDLTALTTPASGDYVPIVDISEVAAASKNKRITIEELMRGMPDGTAAAPGIAFETDPNTGIYSPGADQLAVATNGVGRITVDGSGNVNIDSNTLYVDATNNRVGIGTSAPGSLFHANGFSTTVNPVALGSNANAFSLTAGANVFGLTAGVLGSGAAYLQSGTTSGTGIAYSILLNPNGGNVGIGTASPGYALDISSANTTAGLGYAARIRANATAGAGAIQFTDSAVTTQLGFISFGTNGVGTIHADGASSHLAFGTNSTERARIDSSGRFLVGTSSDSGGALLQVNGDRIRVGTAKTPASASATGATGEICWDANYIYVCTATNTWKRSAISTW